MNCGSCSSQIPDEARFCMTCGAAQSGSSQAPTEIGPRPVVLSDPDSTDSGDGGRFSAGTMLAGRYRIVGLVGKGGMGEVYRADDLKLGQQVALKFLPAVLAADGGRLARFHNEVRIARQVSHPNVCRVYDIGEVDGQHYLSMEYVHGEDLATLLKKIGHFSQERAVQIARQICAGLGAAHDKDVIHRDLKPSNVMLDEDGKVRLTDFGLASLGGDLQAGEIRAGTPFYMAPEQLSGKGVSKKSDIYSLGLVLYELFTGRPPFQSGTIPGPVDRSEGSRPSTPSTLVPGIDPSVERVILRCLEEEPEARPASAIAVAAALPGGDPLAAALAAGETPSPEMVAAAGHEEAARPVVAWTLLVSAVVGLGLALLLAGPLGLVSRVGLSREPGVLLDRSRQVLDRLGHSTEAVHSAYNFRFNGAYFSHAERTDHSQDRWSRLATDRPSALQFWYRESPRPMIADPAFTVINLDDPPPTVSGMASVVLDPDGSLSMYLSVPPQVVETAEASPVVPDWNVLFEEAGLDPGAYEPAIPSWTPPVSSDTRAAWIERTPERPGEPIRLEAAGFGGRIVFFRMIGPWTRPERMEPVQRTTADRIAEALGLGLFVVALLVGATLARRNLRLGRGDRSGAFKLAFFFVTVHVIVWAFWVDHAPDMNEEWQIFMLDTGYSLFLASVLWLVYIAIEPFVRRRWPDSMITWSRVLAGGFRDPLVGRDILVGSLAGTAALILILGVDWIPVLLGWAPPRPIIGNVSFLLGMQQAAPRILDVPVHAVLSAMQAVFIFLLLRLVLRRQWLAAVAFVAVFTPMIALGGAMYVWLQLVFGGLVVALFTFVMIRFGLLALTTAVIMIDLSTSMILTTDWTAWYAGSSILAVLTLAAITVYGFHTAMAGQPLFGSGLFED